MVRGFPELMKSRRKEMRISVEELSRVVQVSKSTIYKYEAGERTPTLMIFLKVCAALRINPQEFLRNR